MYRLSKRSYSRLNGVDAILIAILTEAIKESQHDFGIPREGGFRTSDEQYELYQVGRRDIKNENIITNCDGYELKSQHQLGRAFDIYGYVNGRATWDRKILTEIAFHIIDIAQKHFNVDLQWGGDWRKPDMPHFQL